MAPVQTIPAGTALQTRKPALFEPFRIRGCDFQNRIWVSPMCQYSAEGDGRLTDFHFSHLSAFCLRGPSLTIIEATAVTPEGRITPHDSGLWRESQIDPIARITRFAHDRKQLLGIQLAHAGRKASSKAPWQLSRGLRNEIAPASEGGWPDRVVGPGNEPWDNNHPRPQAMSVKQIEHTVSAFAHSAKLALQARVDVIEIHAAHGYLLSSFLSAVTNKRMDQYGGNLSNRMRFPLEVVTAVRQCIPESMPLLFRISATEWLSEDDGDAWNNDSTVELALLLHKAGIDVLTISSGGNSSRQKVPQSIDYQTKYAREIRRRLRLKGCPLAIGAVGRISEPLQANDLLDTDTPAGDVALIGRQFLKEPSWVLRAAQELGVRVQWPVQYQLGRYGLETKL